MNDFNATVARMINREGYTFDGAVRELARRASIVRRARALTRERKAMFGVIAPHARDKTWANVEAPVSQEVRRGTRL